MNAVFFDVDGTLIDSRADLGATVNFTRRAADITAERQIPIIEEYADELLAGREKWDDTVAEAESYIAAHPELFEPPK